MTAKIIDRLLKDRQVGRIQTPCLYSCNLSDNPGQNHPVWKPGSLAGGLYRPWGWAEEAARPLPGGLHPKPISSPVWGVQSEQIHWESTHQ